MSDLRIERTNTTLLIRWPRRPALRRTGLILAGCAAWCAIAYVIVSDVLAPGSGILPWVLFLAPLLVVPALEKSIRSSVWPGRLQLVKNDGLVAVGRASFQRDQLHQIALQSAGNGRFSVWIRVTVTHGKEIDLAVMEGSDPSEAHGLASQLATFLELPVVQS